MAEREFDFGVIIDFSNYFRALSESKRAAPTDDLASLMLDLLMADTPFARASENPWLALAASQDQPEIDR